ncbi:MAG: DNA repair protein RecO [Gemmatimonadota bacterium]
MGRIIAKTLGVVLRARRMGETSKLVTLYTADFGKLKVTAKGARRPKSPFGGALEPLVEAQVVCYLRDDRELHTLSDADVVRSFPALLADLERLSYASAACEMVERLTIEHEPNARLYRCLTGVLEGMEEVAGGQVEALFWYFQLRAAEALGYRPELGQCLGCGASLAEVPWVRFDPAMGGGRCPACSRPGSGEDGGAGARRLPGDSAAFLARLQAVRAYGRDALPAPPARRGEIRGLLRAFLEYHAGQGGRLRALDFLESVGKGQTPNPAPTAAK